MTMRSSSNGMSNSLHRPTVAVIVPIYNGESDLPHLITRLLTQTYPADRVEYLLVDNGSRDRTPNLLREAVQTAAAKGRSLRALNHTAIQSSYAARNEGIRAASSDIIAFTDADCYPSPQWLEALVQPFVDPEVGLVAGEIQALPGKSWLEQYADRQQTLSQANTLNHPFCAYGQTANLAVRAELFKQVGLFRPYLNTGGDADLCWRLQQQAGARIFLASEAVIQHRHRNTLRELRQQWHRYGCSNRYLHELHGIELTRELKAKEVRYRLLRWLLKELPLGLAKGALGQGHAIDLVTTPLDLICFSARTRGQQQACLPEKAHYVASLEDIA